MELTKIYIDKVEAYPVRKKNTILIYMVSKYNCISKYDLKEKI